MPEETVRTDGTVKTDPKVCPPQVLDLVEHLRSTGTGQAKLEKMTELGKVTKNLDEFLSMLPNNVPAVTLQKVDEYIGKVITEKQEKASGKKMKEAWLNTKKGKQLQKRAKEAADKAEGIGDTVTQTRDESQSSIPEHTVINQSKAPVLQPEGGRSKQLGADVEVPADSVPDDPEDEGKSSKEGAGDEEEAGSEAKSEVADKNVEEARDEISRMRSREKLQRIASTDKRKGVKDAAQQRLQELEGSDDKEEEQE